MKTKQKKEREREREREGKKSEKLRLHNTCGDKTFFDGVNVLH